MTLLQFDLMRVLVYAELRLRGFKIDEGPSSPEELHYLYKVAQGQNIIKIAETGFHLGFSSYAFLKSGKKTSVVSFDLGRHSFVPAAKEIIDRKFPGRHSIIYGDSRSTVPEFAAKNSNVPFDLIFIDGGHEYQIAKADIENMRSLAHSGTLVIMDDLIPWLPWGKGPVQAWTEAIRDQKIEQQELYKDGKPVRAVEPPGERAWALGRYIF
jgi:predicted O-methyltransferase YrrM